MPFYQFNSFTGSLKESTHFQPLYPISPIPLQRSEPPVMIFDSVKTKPVTVQKSTGANYSTLSPHMKKKYDLFQRDITKPVYIMKKADKPVIGLLIGVISLFYVYNVGKMTMLGFKKS